jgi:hypothetical protein
MVSSLKCIAANASKEFYLCPGLSLVFSYDERRFFMHVDFLDQMYYGNYKFTVDLDSGSETGCHQLTVWAAKKINIDHVLLSKFTLEHLFRALSEPHKSRLQAQLEDEKAACREPFDEEIEQLRIPFRDAQGKEQRLPGDVKRQIRAWQDQKQKAEKRLAKDFALREIVTLDRQCFDTTLLQEESHLFEEDHFLRAFYFDEANERYIANFCRKFALDPAYRQEVLSGKARWVERNELFYRNLTAMIVVKTPTLSGKQTYDDHLRELFKWIDRHIAEIRVLPEYQHLKEIDSLSEMHGWRPDPLIQAAIELLNQVSGIVTGSSCQGVSGKVCFEGRELLVISPHMEYAYVSFSQLEQAAHDLLIELLPAFPGITAMKQAASHLLISELRSTGDNFRFREELVELARRMLDEQKTLFVQ